MATPYPTPDILGPSNSSGHDPRTAKIILMWQNTSRLLYVLPWKLMCRSFKLDLELADLKPDGEYVVASNHQSRLDAFTFLAAFTPPLFARLGPFRAITMNMYFNKPWTRFAALGMGCYPARVHQKLPYGLAFAGQVLDKHQTVYIAPEGGLTRRGGRPARPGVTALAQRPNVMIIPAHIEWYRRGRWLRTFKLGIGKPFDGSHLNAEEIMDRVYAQPVD